MNTNAYTMDKTTIIYYNMGEFETIEEIMEYLKKMTYGRKHDSWAQSCEYCLEGGEVTCCTTCYRVYHGCCLKDFGCSDDLSGDFWICPVCFVDNPGLKRYNNLVLKVLKRKQIQRTYGLDALVSVLDEEINEEKQATTLETSKKKLKKSKKPKKPKRPKKLKVVPYTDEEMIKRIAIWRKKRTELNINDPYVYEVRSTFASKRQRKGGRFVKED